MVLCIFKLIFIGVQLLYNAVLVSAVQKSKSVIHKYISTLLFLISLYNDVKIFVHDKCITLF